MLANRPANGDQRGRRQRKRSKHGQAHSSDLTRYYSRKLPTITPGEFEFRLELLRGRGFKLIELDPFVTAFEWADERAVLSGSVELQRPDPEDAESLPVLRGHQVRCQVKWQEEWFELWRMRCEAPSGNVEDGRVTVPLADDMDLLRRGKRQRIYRKTRRRPKGWKGHDILRNAAGVEGIRLGKIAACSEPMPKIDEELTFLDLAVMIYKREAKSTGRRFVLRMRDGRFEVVPYRRNSMVYVLAEELLSALVTRTPKVEKPYTVLTGKGRVGKGSDAKKVRHTEYRREMVGRFGFVEKEKDYGSVESLSELRDAIREDLAEQYEETTEVAISHQGLPFIERGDGAQILLPSEGLKGKTAWFFCASAHHRVASGTYTTDWVFRERDPFAKYEEEREEEARKESEDAYEKALKEAQA